MELNEIIKERYDYLVGLGYEVVSVYLYGSQNYNLHYENSDVDCKAIILPSFEDFILNKQPISKTITLENNEQIDVKDIRLMFGSYLKQNINFIETIFTKYKYDNPKYIHIMDNIYNNSEKIARYNTHSSVNCMYGMSMEKFKALTHPYPSIKHKIDEYHYDSKQLHHILRLYDFIRDYINGIPYSECLISKRREYLIDVKRYKTHSLEEAKSDAKYYMEECYRIGTEYKNNNKLIIDVEVEELFKKVSLEIFKLRFREELK